MPLEENKVHFSMAYGSKSHVPAENQEEREIFGLWNVSNSQLTGFAGSRVVSVGCVASSGKWKLVLTLLASLYTTCTNRRY